jgi:hypothetical protein
MAKLTNSTETVKGIESKFGKRMVKGLGREEERVE